MTTTQLRYTFRPISPEQADELRTDTAMMYVADESPGYPCRQCLRDAAIGDELLLVSFDPFHRDSPYRSASPIFIHRHACGPCDEPGVPEQLTRRQLSVRAFDADALMIDAAIIAGTDLDATVQRFFAESAAEFIHVHNATRGCWAVAVVR